MLRPPLAHGLPTALVDSVVRRRWGAVAAAAHGRVGLLGERGGPLPKATEVVSFRADAGSFDTVVSVLGLCQVDDLAATLAGIRGALRPGGRLLFVEHVAGTGGLARLQQAVAPIVRRLPGGCDPGRSTTHAVREAGFVIDDLERFDPIRGKSRRSTWVQGEAYPKVGG